MTKEEDEARASCAKAGWSVLGVGDGTRDLVVYGSAEALTLLQQQLLSRVTIPPELRSPGVAKILGETLGRVPKAELGAAEEEALRILHQFLGVLQTPPPRNIPSLSLAGPARTADTKMEVSVMGWEEIVTDWIGLTIMRPSPHAVQFRRNGKVLAEWWPGKGTTMANGRRGPVCKDGDELVGWLESFIPCEQKSD